MRNREAKEGEAAVLIRFKPETKGSLCGLDSTKLLGKLTNSSNLFRAVKIANGTEKWTTFVRERK